MKVRAILVCVALVVLGGCATRKSDRCNPVWLGQGHATGGRSTVNRWLALVHEPNLCQQHRCP